MPFKVTRRLWLRDDMFARTLILRGYEYIKYAAVLRRATKRMKGG